MKCQGVLQWSRGQSPIRNRFRFERVSQIPHTVQIALRPGSWTPKIEHPPIEVFHFSPESLSSGVENHLIDGVTARVFSREKTLADIFKFRNRIGMEVATEALRNYARSKRRRFDKVLDFARVCRVESIMRPYLEAWRERTQKRRSLYPVVTAIAGEQPGPYIATVEIRDSWTF